MGERYLAGELEERGRLRIVEIHLFANGTVNVRGHLHWDVPNLYEELVTEGWAFS
jgi:hypothetical protein